MKKWTRLLLLLMTISLFLTGCGQREKENVKKVGEYRILLGGFHDHWKRTGQDNPALLLAALDYYHYDFMCLMGGDSVSDPMTKKGIEAYSKNKKIYLGKEQFFGWGHVVTVRNHPKGIDNSSADYWGEMRRLKAGGGLVAMAHPVSHPGSDSIIFRTGVMDSMLAAGVIDAAQPELEPAEIEWMERRNREGKKVPVICGWDIHYVLDLPGLPPVLYDTSRTPYGHLDSGGRFRNIIIGADNTFESILAAVRDGRSVIEDMRPGPAHGKLYGERRWVKYLEDHGYHEMIRRLDSIRDSKTLAVDKKEIHVGDPLTLRFSEPCTVRIPGTLTEPVTVKTDGNGILHIDKMPALLDRDRTFYPVAAYYKDGTERDFAIVLDHKFSFDVYPSLKDGKNFLKIRFTRSIKGKVSPVVDGQQLPEQSFEGEEALVDITALHPAYDRAVVYQIRVTDEEGVSRTKDGYVNFTTARYFPGSWEQLPAVLLNTADREIMPGYGTTRPYPGPDVFSAEIKFAWTEKHFLMHVKVVDSVNYNPYMTSKSYQGDVIQLGIDPMLRRSTSLGHTHMFNLSLSPKGPLLWRWKSAVEEKSDSYTPLPEDVPLWDKYLKITPWKKGIIYDLKLPWSQLAPAHPAPGKQLGIYVLIANNNGHSFLDMFGWPYYLENGGYLKPHTWGFLTLIK
jgi:hypothetical protein